MAASFGMQSGYGYPNQSNVVNTMLAVPPSALAAIGASLTAAMAPAPCSLPSGMPCRYKSDTHGWMPCKILQMHSDGTYDLNVRQRAKAEKIAPVSNGVLGTSVWPIGSLVYYQSQSIGGWIPTEIRSFNETDTTYNLGVREHAHSDRIRARAVPVSGQNSAHPSEPVQSQTTPYTPNTAQQSQFNQSFMSTPMSTTSMPYPFWGSAVSTCASMPPPVMNPMAMAPPASMMNPMVPPIVSAPATIEPIVHPGHEPRADEELVGVIVTVCDGGSFDPLFSQIPQLAGDGNRVATYAASPASLPHIVGDLSGQTAQGTRSSALHRNLRRLVSDIRAVQADSVVFNWECCSGCATEHFHDSHVVMELVQRLLSRGHMVMFSDFSLKALIRDWEENILGPNPFVKAGAISSNFQLCFDPTTLSTCPSAQLQKLGELASDGKALVNAMSNTIAFSVRWSKADCNAYQCQVLTVMSEFDGRPTTPALGEICEVGDQRGLAGHVLLTYPSGGRLLASAGHWVELSRLDVTEANLLQAASAFGAMYVNEVQSSLASCSNNAERQQALQTYSCQMIQQSSPCSYSMRPTPQQQRQPATM